MKCRFCNTLLKHEFVDLIASPPSNSYLRESDLDAPEAYFPLKVFVCEKCFLVQLAEYKSHKEIFDKDYAYFSSYSTSWLKHCKDYVEMISQRLKLNETSQVIEIASNDGYLLQYFKQKGIPCLGIEPTGNTAKAAQEKGIETLVEFFGEKLAETLTKNGRKADLIIGNNVLAHVPDINDFVKGLKIALKEEGSITMEFPHLLQLIQNKQFDTIYHEHFSYLSLLSVREIFNANGLQVYDADEIPTHGGSLRIYATHLENKTASVSQNIAKILTDEKKAMLDRLEGYLDFQTKVDEIKNAFLSFLLNAQKQNKKVIAYGAAAKGNTLLNYCGVKPDLIGFVVDASPAKQNKYLPGSRIPIFKEEKIKDFKPDYVVILPWNIREEIMSQLSYIKDWDAKFVIAIPELKIL